MSGQNGQDKLPEVCGAGSSALQPAQGVATPPDPDAPHILVVDDDRRLCGLIARLLRESGFMVSTAHDAAEARAKLAMLTVDLLVLDVMMPGESGLDLTQALRRDGDLPILLLTAMDGAEDRIAGLETGADDYLTKPFEPRELLARVKSILRRSVPRAAAAAPAFAGGLQGVTLRFGPWTFDLGRQELRRNGEIVHLTQGEATLLGVLAAAPNRPISRDELADRAQIRGGDRAVDVQIVRLRRKIEDDPRNPRHIHTLRGAGYALRTDG
jgi:two-component system phosphate regulon response regulator OmpR